MVKITYTKEQKKQIITGMILILLGILGFFISMAYFKLFDTDIEYNVSYISREITPFLCMILGMYGIGYLYGGNKAGLIWAKWWSIILIGAYIIGYLGMTYTPSIQPFFPIIIILIAYFCFGYFQGHNWRKGFKNVAIIFLAIVAVLIIKIIFKQ